MSEVENQTQAGYYLQGLVSHLNSVIPKRQHKMIECWMEDIEIMIGSKNQGQGADIGFISYSAQFTFERFPFKDIDPAMIIANVIAWLDDNDEHRERHELSDPSFDIESEGDKTVSLALDIEFIEPLMVVPDEANGNILWKGSKWALAPYEIWTATHGDVIIKNSTNSND